MPELENWLELMMILNGSLRPVVAHHIVVRTLPSCNFLPFEEREPIKSAVSTPLTMR